MNHAQNPVSILKTGKYHEIFSESEVLWKSFGNCNFQRIFKGFYQDFKIFSCLWAVVFDNLFCVSWAGDRTKSPRTKSPRTKPPGQNPPGQNPPRTKSPQTKSPQTKSPWSISPQAKIPPSQNPPKLLKVQ